MTTSTSYWENIPLWNSDNPERSYDITADGVSAEINKSPEILRKNI